MNEERALSFGQVAEDYDRYRPGPSGAAVAWILGGRVRRAADLGAGTGSLSRVLEHLAEAVVAIEPDPRMRKVLRRRSRAVALGALGQALPFADACLDAVVVSSAWHWMEGEETVAEVARVLRPGGIFGVLWNGPDPAASWVRSVLGFDGERAAASEGHRHVLDLPAEAPFADLEERVVGWSTEVTPGDLVGLVGTYSRVITLAERDRARVLEEARRKVATVPHSPAGTIELPLRSRCWRARRR